MKKVLSKIGRKKNFSYNRRREQNVSISYVDIKFEPDKIQSFETSPLSFLLMKENKFQSGLIKKIKKNFPDSIVLKTNPNYIQGIPDLIILYSDKWVALECKRSEKAHHQPNQEYYISKMNSMSYASFVYPENERRVLDEMESALRGSRRSRISKSK